MVGIMAIWRQQWNRPEIAGGLARPIVVGGISARP
jgi:hypothetical protein